MREHGGNRLLIAESAESNSHQEFNVCIDLNGLAKTR